MKRFRKIYLEISNICNLNCAFCPGTTRPLRAMNESDFSILLDKIRPWTDYLYFHLMGEPLCHPQLERFLELANDAGFRVIITTNGTLLRVKNQLLLHSPAVHKVNVSLHAFEANDLSIPFSEYLRDCLSFGQTAAGSKIVCYRLWNQGAETRNNEIIETMHHYFPGNWVEQNRGTRISDGIYLEYAEQFDWPDLSCPEGSDQGFCYGLRDQLGILSDGTVVPCCLDHNGDLALGNLFQQEMEEILNSSRATAIYEGFSNRRIVESLCRRCGYARRFQKN